MSFSRVGPNQTIERGQFRVAKSSGESKRRTCINVWEQTFQKMFQRAGIEGHSHQLRHTFAVGLLQKGVSMENVAALLGHQNIKITQKHYASWVAGRQQHLDEEVRRTW